MIIFYLQVILKMRILIIKLFKYQKYKQKKKRGHLAKINKQKTANNNKILNQGVTIPESAQTSTSIIQTISESTQTSTPIMQTIFESIAQTSTSIVQTISESTTQIPIPIIKPQTKTSWIWNYYIKKLNKKEEMHAYCQFVMGNEEKCTKNYKYE